MRLILAVDALFPPVTGIGRYTAELLRGIRDCGECESLRYYLHGRWIDDAAVERLLACEEDPAAAPPPRARLRTALARNRLAVAAYGVLMPALARWRLRRCRDHLFHSPNFLLPPFPGRSIATIHDLSTVLYPEFHPAARVSLMNRAIPAALARADRLVTPSAAVRGELLAHADLPPERVVSIPMGVDPAFAPREAATLQRDLAALGLAPGRYLLCVATLEPRKNIDRLIDAWQALPAPERSEYPLVLAGAPGWNSGALTERVRALSGRGELRHLGYVPQGTLPALYAGARLFAFPSLYEGFGLPVLEAMASGVPVVTSDRSSLPEVAGDAALLVDPTDTAALSSALARGLEDAAWRAQATTRGLARAAGLGWRASVARTLDLYRSLQP